MKNIAFVTVLAAAALAVAGMTGDFNTWFGHLAGENATGERTTVQGAGAGGEAKYIERTDFIGAAAGVYSRDIRESVGIGYRAMRGTANCSNVVAIGSHALESVSNINNATWINGHICVQGGRFFISPDRSKTWENAPFYFDGSRFKLLDRPILNLSFDANGKIALFDGTNKIGIVAVEAENSYRVVAAWHEVDPFEEGEPITSRGTVEFRISGVQWNGNSVQFHLSGPNGQCDIDYECYEWPFYISALTAAGINCKLKILGPGTLPPSWLLVGDTYWTIDEFHVFSY